MATFVAVLNCFLLFFYTIGVVCLIEKQVETHYGMRLYFGLGSGYGLLFDKSLSLVVYLDKVDTTR